MQGLRILLVGGLLLGLTGCLRKDIAYWRSHPHERAEKLATCEASTGNFDPTCKTAALAEDPKPVIYWMHEAHWSETEHFAKWCIRRKVVLGDLSNCGAAEKANQAINVFLHGYGFGLDWYHAQLHQLRVDALTPEQLAAAEQAQESRSETPMERKLDQRIGASK